MHNTVHGLFKFYYCEVSSLIKKIPQKRKCNMKIFWCSEKDFLMQKTYIKIALMNGLTLILVIWDMIIFLTEKYIINRVTEVVEDKNGVKRKSLQHSCR